MTHLLFDWDSFIWSHWNRDLGARFTYIRYDERGCGSSEREPAEISEVAWLNDLNSVIDASGFNKVALIGTSHAAPIAIEYAARNPDRVSHIVSIGGFAAGGLAPGVSSEEAARSRVFIEAIRAFWDAPDEFFRGLWSYTLIPDATPERWEELESLMRRTSSGEIAARISENRHKIDVRQLAGTVTTPALVVHARNDHLVPFEFGVELASLLPNASLVALDSRNHLPLEEPAWDTLVAEIGRFIGVRRIQRPPKRPVHPLSTREYEVLSLVAEGLSNSSIGDELSLSTRTVERHMSNVYRKLGVSGRTARAAAAARFSDLPAPA